MADRDSAAQARWTDPGTGKIVRHPYERSPYSGAGNCWCGLWEESRIHPHVYSKARASVLCICAWPADHEIHTAVVAAV